MRIYFSNPTTKNVDPMLNMTATAVGLNASEISIDVEDIEVFSLSFGGMGGSFGGKGGLGRGRNQATHPFRCDKNILAD